MNPFGCSVMSKCTATKYMENNSWFSFIKLLMSTITFVCIAMFHVNL